MFAHSIQGLVFMKGLDTNNLPYVIVTPTATHICTMERNCYYAKFFGKVATQRSDNEIRHAGLKNGDMSGQVAYDTREDE